MAENRFRVTVRANVTDRWVMRLVVFVPARPLLHSIVPTAKTPAPEGVEYVHPRHAWVAIRDPAPDEREGQRRHRDAAALPLGRGGSGYAGFDRPVPPAGRTLGVTS